MMTSTLSLAPRNNWFLACGPENAGLICSWFQQNAGFDFVDRLGWEACMRSLDIMHVPVERPWHELKVRHRNLPVTWDELYELDF